jgi:hypothetical protein
MLIIGILIIVLIEVVVDEVLVLPLQIMQLLVVVFGNMIELLQFLDEDNKNSL